MKSTYQLAFAALVLAFLALAPSAAHASTAGVEHMHTHAHTQMFHDRGPHVHTHGSHSHHG